MDLHERYGPVIRISPSELCFSDPQAWKDIYGLSNGKENPKYHGLYGRLSSNMAESILAADQEEHRIMRGIISDGFSDKAIKNQEGLITGHVDVMIQKLKHLAQQKLDSEEADDCKQRKSEGLVVDLNKWFYWVTSDIISDLALGESLHCLKNLETPQYLLFLSIVPEWLLKAVVLRHIGLGSIVDIMTYISGVFFARILEGMKERLSQRTERRKKGTDPIDLLLDARDSEVSHYTQTMRQIRKYLHVCLHIPFD